MIVPSLLPVLSPIVLFVAILTISDKANGSSSVDYPTFEREAAHHCASITARLVEILASK